MPEVRRNGKGRTSAKGPRARQNRSNVGRGGPYYGTSRQLSSLFLPSIEVRLQQVRGHLISATRRGVCRELYHFIHCCVDVECSNQTRLDPTSWTISWAKPNLRIASQGHKFTGHKSEPSRSLYGSTSN